LALTSTYWTTPSPSNSGPGGRPAWGFESISQTVGVLLGDHRDGKKAVQVAPLSTRDTPDPCCDQRQHARSTRHPDPSGHSPSRRGTEKARDLRQRGSLPTAHQWRHRDRLPHAGAARPRRTAPQGGAPHRGHTADNGNKPSRTTGPGPSATSVGITTESGAARQRARPELQQHRPEQRERREQQGLRRRRSPQEVTAKTIGPLFSQKRGPVARN
jgi:hypothetical protein